eukprot:916407-Rhodomonas_salina.2
MLESAGSSSGITFSLFLARPAQHATKIIKGVERIGAEEEGHGEDSSAPITKKFLNRGRTTAAAPSTLLHFFPSGNTIGTVEAVAVFEPACFEFRPVVVLTHSFLLVASATQDLLSCASHECVR